MGGFIAPSTTIGGSALAPGIPLQGSPLSGLFQNNGGIGLSLNASTQYFQTLQNMYYGTPPNNNGVINPVAGNPFASGLNPEYCAVDPTNRFLYVANFGSNTISGYLINAATGVLTSIIGSPFASGAGPRGCVIDPTGKYLYVANNGGGANSISAYAINPNTGALSTVAGSPFASGVGTASVAIAPAGNFLYAVNYTDNTIYAYTINPATGVLTHNVTGSPFGTAGNAGNVILSPDGTKLFVIQYVGNMVSTFTVNTVTGVITPVASYATGLAPRDCAVDNSGKFLVVPSLNSNTISIYNIVSNATMTPVVGSPFAAGNGPAGLVINPITNDVYIANFNGNTITAYTLSSAGVPAVIAGSPFATSAGPNSLTMSSTGKFLFAVNYTAAGASVYTFGTQTHPLIEATFDMSGGTNGSVNINGAFYIQGNLVASYPPLAGNPGKYLRIDTQGNLVWDGVNTNIPVAMVANAGALAVDDSGNYIVDLSGVLTAQGTLTITHSVPTNTTLLIFDNATTGAFALVTAGTLGVFTIPRGKSIWYWNGTTCEYISGGGSDTPNVTPLPAPGSVVTVPHYLGVTPSWVSLELICLTAEFGYAIGDVVEVTSQATAGLVLTPITYYKDMTIVGFTMIAANSFALMNATTGAYVLPTAANWAYRFGIDR